MEMKASISIEVTFTDGSKKTMTFESVMLRDLQFTNLPIDVSNPAYIERIPGPTYMTLITDYLKDTPQWTDVPNDPNQGHPSG